MTTGLYVYALVPADSVATSELPAGIDAAPLRLVDSDGITAIVHESDTEPYQGPDSEVQRWILEHSQVVDDAWQAAGTVLPMTFNVIVAPDPETQQDAAQRLEQWLAASGATIRDHLERLREYVELRVDISLDEEAATASHDDLGRSWAGQRKRRGMGELLHHVGAKSPFCHHIIRCHRHSQAVSADLDCIFAGTPIMPGSLNCNSKLLPYFDDGRGIGLEPRDDSHHPFLVWSEDGTTSRQQEHDSKR